jgi:hypothetical protein
MPERHVRDLVGEYARQLTFAPHALEEAAVDVHVSSRQCERVHVGEGSRSGTCT